MSGITKPISTDTKLKRIAVRSKENPLQVFWGLMPHFTEEALLQCFHELDGKKALGVDRQTKEEYGKNLHENIEGLVGRLKGMEYMPGPVREVLIPKEDGRKRPLGISNFEDKIVQKMMGKVLEAVYEPLFHNFSYGFRRGRNCHDAIMALQNHLFGKQVEYVLDVDLQNFFGTISHERLMRVLRMKIKDRRLLEYVRRMLRSGVLSNGELKKTAEGTPQGSICSPILANIYAHYAYDEWFSKQVAPRVSENAAMFRYADDLVICGTQNDVERIAKAFKGRTERFLLSLNEEKTKVVSFDKREVEREKQGTFDFLGFTFYLGKGRRGYIVPKLKTSRKRFTAKLKVVGEWCRRNRDSGRLNQVWDEFCIKLRGHIQYYGVSLNGESVGDFSHKAIKIFFKWMNRRSQKKSFNWKIFNRYMELRPPPKIRICHNLFAKPMQ